MLRAIDPDYIWDFSLEPDTVEDRTIFKLGIVDALLMSAINDGRTRYKLNRNGDDAPSDVTFWVQVKDIEIVRFGLKGWKNFAGSDGKEIAFRTEAIPVTNVGRRQGLPDELLKKFDITWIQKLAVEITSAHRLSEQEIKN